jgi:hypothetical protein
MKKDTKKECFKIINNTLNYILLSPAGVRGTIETAA